MGPYTKFHVTEPFRHLIVFQMNSMGSTFLSSSVHPVPIPVPDKFCADNPAMDKNKEANIKFAFHKYYSDNVLQNKCTWRMSLNEE